VVGVNKVGAAGRSRRFYCAIGMLLGIISCGTVSAESVVRSAPDYAVVAQQLRQQMTELMDDEDIAGMSIALIDGDRIVWSDGVGYADKENKIPATARTVYQQGSISSTFTALAIMQLVAQGKVDLDAPVTRYLPQFSMVMPAGQSLQAITIRRLLSHHAGLPLSQFKGMWEEQPISLQQWQTQMKDVAASYPVDYVFAYSNLGYDLLGRVVEVVSGQPFAQYMQQKIFTPLRLESSGYSLRDKYAPRMAVGYKKQERRPLLPTRDLPAVGLNSSVEDVATLAIQMMQRGGDGVLPEHLRRQMMSVQNSQVERDLGRDVGFAWRLGPLPAMREYQMVWSLGAAMTHRSRVAFVPELNIGVVVAANSSQSFRAVEKMSNAALRVMLEARLGRVQASDEVSVPPLATALEPFAPAYAGFLGLLQVTKDGNEYDVNLLGWDFRLIPRGDGWYRLEYDLFGLIPLKLDWIAQVSVAATSVQGQRVAVVSYLGVNYLFAQALAPVKPTAVWNSRRGRYAPAQMDSLLRHYEVTAGELKFADGYYFFEYKLPYWVPLKMRLPLVPVSAQEMRIPGIGTGLGERVKFDAQGRAWYSGYELQRVN